MYGRESLRKTVSLILTLAMCIGCLPTGVLAAGYVAAAGDDVQEEAGAYEDGDAPNDSSGGENAGEVPPSDRSFYNREEFLLDFPEESGGAASEGVSPLSGYAVSGTVSLPDGVTAASDYTVRVYAYYGVMSGSGRVNDGASYYTAIATIPAGYSAAFYTLLVPSGSYIIGARMDKGDAAVLGQTSYYSAASGSVVNRCAGTAVTVGSANVSGIDFSLKRSGSSVSGTLTFPGALTEAQSITVTAYSYLPEGTYDYSYATVTAQAGSDSVPFSVGTGGSQCTYLNFIDKTTGITGCYSLDGGLTSAYSDRRYLNLSEHGVSGLAIDASVLLSGGSSGGGGGYKVVSMTVNLTHPVSGEYFILVTGADSYREGYWITPESGATSFSCDLALNSGNFSSFCVSYEPVDGADTAYFDSGFGTYLTQTATTGYSEDAYWWPLDGTDAISVTEPEMYTVSGVISRDTAADVDSYAYAQADFGSGGIYSDRVFFESGADTAPFTIYVPRSLNGQSFALSAAACSGWTYNTVISSTRSGVQSPTLGENMSGYTLNLNESFTEYSGVFSLPTGVQAGPDGLTVSFGGYDNDEYELSQCAAYFMAPGASSVTYSFMASAAYDSIYAEIENPPDGVFYRTFCPVSDSTQADFAADRAYIVSGTLSLPSGYEGSATFSISTGQHSSESACGNYMLLTVDSGTSAAFSIPVCTALALQGIYVNVEAGTSDGLYEDTMYVTPSGTLSIDYSALDIAVEEDWTGLELVAAEGRAISGTVTLPEGGYFSGGSIFGNVYAVGLTSGTVYGDYFNMSPGDNSAGFSVSVPVDSTENYSVYVRLFNSAGVTTNLVSDTNCYYAAAGTTYDVSSADSVAPGTSGLVIPLLKGLVFNGIVSVPGTGTFTGGDLTGNLLIDYSREGGAAACAFGDILIPEGATSAGYSVCLPADAAIVDSICLYIERDPDMTTNVMNGVYCYWDGSSWTADYWTVDAALNGEDVTFDIELPLAVTFSGTVSVPDGGTFSGGDLTGTVQVSFYYGNEYISTASCDFTIAQGATSAKYSVCLPADAASICCICLNIDANPDLTTNLLTGSSRYWTGSAWSDSYISVNIDITESNMAFNIEVPLAAAFWGAIALPDNGSFSGGDLTGTLEVSYYYGSADSASASGSFTIASGGDSATYRIMLPSDAKSIYRVSLSVDSSSGVTTNIATGIGFYWTGSGWSSSSCTVNIPVDSTGATLNIVLPLARIIEGTISLPDGAVISGGSLTGTVYAYADREYSCGFTLASGGSADYVLKLPEDTVSVQSLYYTISGGGSVTTNLITETFFYLAEGGWTISESGARPLALTDDVTDLDLTLKKADLELKGTISAPDGCILRGGDITGYIRASADSGDYYGYFTLGEGEDSADYIVGLPAGTETVTQIALYVNSDSSATTNIRRSATLYWTGSGWSESADAAAPASLNGSGGITTLDFDFPLLPTLSGAVSLPAEGYINGGTYSGYVRATVDGIYYDGVFSVTGDGGDYFVVLPDGAEEIDSILIYLIPDAAVDGNLLTGVALYYTAAGWRASEDAAEALPLTQLNTALNVTLRTATAIAGTVALPASGTFGGTALSGYVRAYTDSASYIGYFSIPSGGGSASYRVVMPFSTEAVTRLEVRAYSSGAGTTNILTDVSVYYKPAGWTADESEAGGLTLSEGEKTVNVTLPLAETLSGTVSAPEGMTGAASGYVYVAFGSVVLTRPFTVSDGSSSPFSFSVPARAVAGSFCVYYELNDFEDDDLVGCRVYIDADGGYCTNPALAYRFIPGSADGENADFTAARWEDFGSDFLIQSVHPYAASAGESYEYTYPGTADSIKVSFSEMTMTESGYDEIQVYDGTGALFGTYSGYALSGATLDIPGSGFTVTLSSDATNNSYFGFGITDIVPVNGVPDKTCAVSVVKLNGEDNVGLIHNSGSVPGTFRLVTAGYSETGKMVGVVVGDIAAAPGISVLDFDTDAIGGAILTKCYVLGENEEPLIGSEVVSVVQNAVKYDYNDGLNNSSFEYVTYGSSARRPAIDPARPGYAFTGWYTSADCGAAYDFSARVFAETTVYAGWAQEYRLNVLTEGDGSAAVDGADALYAAPGTSVSVTATPGDGSCFAGWTADGLTPGDSAGLQFEMPENDVSLTARFEKELKIAWDETGLTIGGEEAAFNGDTLSVTASKTPIALSGTIEGSEQVASASYDYKYFTTADGAESYETLESVPVTLDGLHFTLSDLPVGVGTNLLTITVSLNDGTETALEYRIVGNSSGIAYQKDVTTLSIGSSADLAVISDFATGIAAYWNYDSGTAGDPTDDETVLILDRTSEIATRLMLPESSDDHLSVGQVWVIPACDEFPSGYSFEIVEFGDIGYEPQPDENDMFYGQTFAAEDYIYLLVREPSLESIFDGAFSFDASGISGVAFSLMPGDTQLMYTEEYGDGTQSVSVFETEQPEYGTVTHKGFQYQNILSGLVPTANVSNTTKKINFSLKFNDTILYDKDGNKNTTYDQLALGGEVSFKDVGVAGAFEYHPSVNLNPLSESFGVHVLPQQIGLLVDYTKTETFKATLGGTIGKKPPIGGTGEGSQWSLKEIVKDFQKQFGAAGGNTKKSVSVLGFDFNVEGVNMDSTIVLAAVGFNLATLSPAGTGYDRIAISSTYLGFDPILVFMVTMDIDGKIEAKLSYEYAKTSYNQLGFNIVEKGYRETNAKIAEATPTSTSTAGNYNIEYFSGSYVSAANRETPEATHTITATGKATAGIKFSGGMGLLMCGLNIAQAKIGAYADASAALTGSAVFSKGSSPDIDFDGALDLSAGWYWGVYSRLYANTALGNFGFDTSYERKYELLHWGISSVSLAGKVTECGQEEASDGSETEPVCVGGAKVTLEKRDSTASAMTATTDQNGKYSFKGLSAGTYRLTIEKDGYVTYKDDYLSISGTDKVKDVALDLSKFCALKGTVVDADNASAPLSGVRITLVKTNSTSTVKLYKLTDDSGSYTLGAADDAENGLTPGVYKLTASLTGYQTQTQTIIIKSSDHSNITNAQIGMTAGTYGNGTASGHIYDVATGEASGVSYRLDIRKGSNSTAGSVIKTITAAADGSYSVTLPVGYYTVTVTDPRTGIGGDAKYFSTTFNILVRSGAECPGQNGYVSLISSANQIRVVLTWGETPSDLDSHLLGPTVDGSGRFHTYYSHKTYIVGSRTYADLDLDDTTSYGPETTTIYFLNGSGVYSYYVHDFTNEASTASTAMSLSGAQVRVYIGSSLVATYNVPGGVIGTVWHVFDYDAATGALTAAGSMYNCSSPGDVGLMEVYGAGEEQEFLSDLEKQDIAVIGMGLDEKR